MGHIVANRLPWVENATFNITSTMLHLMGMKGFFYGLPLEDTNKHIKILIGCVLKYFDELFLAYNISCISQEGIKLTFFSLCLTGEATTWLGLEASITTWIEIIGAFLHRLFPLSTK